MVYIITLLCVLAVTPLMNITSKNNTPRSNSAAVITYTYVLGPVIGLVLFILCTVGTIGLYRYRLRKSRDLLISNPIPLGRYVATTIHFLVHSVQVVIYIQCKRENQLIKQVY